MIKESFPIKGTFEQILEALASPADIQEQSNNEHENFKCKGTSTLSVLEEPHGEQCDWSEPRSEGWAMRSEIEQGLNTWGRCLPATFTNNPL